MPFGRWAKRLRAKSIRRSHPGRPSLFAWNVKILEDRTLLASAQLVKDINQTPSGSASSAPEQLTAVGNLLFFTADAVTTGNELYVSDGTEAGTRLLKDIRPGATGGNVTNLFAFNGVLYFSADDGGGRRLWRSDGTEAGTFIVRPSTSGGPINASNFVVFSNALYFSAGGAGFAPELWKTDGTMGGTVLVKDIRPGTAGSYPQNLTVSNGQLYFLAKTAPVGTGLWKSDGTSDGTVLVKEFTAANSNPRNLTDVNGTIFFLAQVAGETGLWKSDGTGSGTILVKNFSPTPYTYPQISELTSFNNQLFFTAPDSIGGSELWRSNGTLAGTIQVKDINPGAADSSPADLIVANGSLFFSALAPTTGRELYRSDGTTAGTVIVKDIVPGANSSFPSELAVIGSLVYFKADETTSVWQLWKSDGTLGGTVRVQTGTSGPGIATYPAEITNVAGTLYFSAANPLSVGRELWKSDGTSPGTVLVRDITTGASSGPLDFLTYQGKTIFSAYEPSVGREIWETDGTAAGTKLFLDVIPGATGSSPGNFLQFGNLLLFTVANQGLWKTDGTPAGTTAITTSLSSIGGLMEFGGFVYFYANDGIKGLELWRTDGTTAGTTLAVDIRTGFSGSSIDHLSVFNGHLYFLAQTSGNMTLYRSDGTASGTEALSPLSMYIARYSAFENKLVFRGMIGSGPQEMWITDGTLAGTHEIKDLGAADVWQHIVVGDTLYLRVGASAEGIELWRSDGTAAGTTLLKDIVPGPGTGVGTEFVVVGDTLYFQGIDPVHRTELWKTDGTPAGTVLVKDIVPGTASSMLLEGTNVGGLLYFQTNDGQSGYELWVSDGTEAGTVLVADIADPGDSFPRRPTVIGDRAYFDATNDVIGNELWAILIDHRLDDIALSQSAVVENAAANATIGNLATLGIVTGDTFTYALVPGAGDVDNGAFSIVGDELRLIGIADFESKSAYSVRIRSTSQAGLSIEKSFAITITDINEAPAVALTGVTSTLPENTGAPVEVATIVVSDDALGTNSLSLSGADVEAFELVGSALQFKSGVLLDFESKASYSVTVNVEDPAFLGVESSVDFTLAVTDVNEVPFAVTLSDVVTTLPENTVLTDYFPVARVHIHDDALGTNAMFFRGSDGAHFVHFGDILMLRPGTILDFESDPVLTITIHADDVVLPDPGYNEYPFTTFTLTLTDVNDPPSISLVGTSQVAENSALPTMLAVVQIADDALGEEVLSLSGPDADLFTLVGNQIRPSSAWTADFEQKSTYNVTVNVDDPTLGPGVDHSVDYVLSVVDVNEAPTAVIHALGVASIGENGSPPYIFSGEIVVVDDALGTNILGLSGPDAGYFAIRNNHLEFHGASLDFETKPVYEVVITVDDPAVGGPVDAFTTFTFWIADINEFAVSPIVDTDPAISSIPEHSPAGTPVGITAFAQDLDGSQNGITYSLWNTRGGRFAIDPATGVVTIADGTYLDREVQASWTITVLATSQDGSVSVKEFSIELDDVNEFKVGPLWDLDPAPNRVPEHSPAGTPVGIAAFAIDLDATGSSVAYSLWDTRGGRFAIDPVTGLITVANGEYLDREVTGSWSLAVLATSQDGSVSVKEFTVELVDVDEFNVGQVFDLNPASNTILENAPNGTPVGITGFAIDLDATNSGVTYSLWNTRGGRFAVDPATGVVTIANGALIDREAAGSWTITLLATSADGSISVREFTIAVQDVDEHDVGPVFDLDPAPNSVSENAAQGTAVGITGFGIDLDATDSGVNYSLTDTAGGRFAIHSSTGVVTLANPSLLDREAPGAASSYDITVCATSQDGSTSLKVFTIHVTDADEFDVGPVSDADAAANTVAENAGAGTLVGVTARATDGDASNNTVTYSLTNSAGGRFQIDPVTGVVSVANGAVLDFEAQTSHDITVQATSSDGSTSSQSFTIEVTNVSDAPRITLSNDSMAENRPSGTVVGTLGLSDSNAASPVYSLVSGTGGTDNSKFSISGNQLRTRSSFNFETKSSYSIRVRMRAAGGVELIQVFTIQVTNVNEGPTGLTLSPAAIAENNAVGQTVGTLSAIDPDSGDTFNYSLVSGSGSTDNARFTIEGNELRAAEAFDYERKRSYSIRVRVTDAAGLTYEKVLTVRVENGPG